MFPKDYAVINKGDVKCNVRNGHLIFLVTHDFEHRRDAGGVAAVVSDGRARCSSARGAAHKH